MQDTNDSSIISPLISSKETSERFFSQVEHFERRSYSQGEQDYPGFSVQMQFGELKNRCVA